MNDYFTLSVAFLFGLLVGSFLNVVIYRIPRSLPVVRGRSKCPSCGEPIPWYRNVPLFGFLVSGGKASCCSTRIAWRYPVVELLCGLLFAGVVLVAGASSMSIRLATLGSLLIAMSFIDGEFRIIPDKLVMFGLFIAFGVALYEGFESFYVALIGFFAGGGSLLGFWFLGKIVLKKDGLGGGDIKLAALIGAFVGWKLVLLALFLGFLGVFFFGVVGMITRRLTKQSEIPLAPFLTFGVVVAVVFGSRIIHMYLEIIHHL